MKRLLLLLTAMATLVSSAPVAALEFDTVAVSGRPAGDLLTPPLSGDIDWRSFGSFTINEAGQVALSARVQGTGVVTSNDTIVIRWTNGVYDLLAREGSQAAGYPVGVNWGSLTTTANRVAAIAEDGSVGITVDLAGAGISAGSNSATFASLAGPGTGTKIQQAGDLTPGEPGTIMGQGTPLPYTLSYGSQGQVMFDTTVTGPGVSGINDRLLIYGSRTAPTSLVREGDAAVGLPMGVVYDDVNITRATYAGNGFAAFVAGLSGPGVIDDNSAADNSQALYLFDGSTTIMVYQRGDTLPGSTDFIGNISNLRSSASGHVLMGANLNQMGLESAILRNPDGSFDVLGRGGEPAPGTTAAFGQFVYIGSAMRSALLNDSGEVAFTKLLTGDGVNASNDQGLWIFDGSSTELVLREGDAAPGLANLTIGEIGDIAFNDMGEVIAQTLLVGPGIVAGENDRAIWHIDSVGIRSLVVRSGELFDVNPDGVADLRTISSPGGASSTPRLGGLEASVGVAKIGSFTNSGYLALQMNFSDGSQGVFVTNLRVPEPAAIGLVLLAATAVGLRRSSSY